MEPERAAWIREVRSVLGAAAKHLILLGVDYQMAKVHFRDMYRVAAIEVTERGRGRKARAAQTIGVHRNTLTRRGPSSRRKIENHT
jgi:hypothetical protein